MLGRVNEPVTIYANVVNPSDEQNPFTAVLKINGQQEDVWTGMLDPNTGASLEFTVYKNKPGTYIVDVNGKQASFQIIDDGSQVAGNPLGSINSGHLFILILAMLVLIALGALIIQRRRVAHY